MIVSGLIVYISVHATFYLAYSLLWVQPVVAATRRKLLVCTKPTVLLTRTIRPNVCYMARLVVRVFEGSERSGVGFDARLIWPSIFIDHERLEIKFNPQSYLVPRLLEVVLVCT